MSDEAVAGQAGLLSRLSVVLVRPREASNVGAVARVMANFGVRNAVLVAPRCDSSSVDARQNATGSGAVPLATMRVVKSIQDVAAENHIFAAVVPNAGQDSSQALTIDDIVGKLRHGPVSLVFGPEETGLTESDLKQCSFVVRIPVAETAANLNLSHAVAIVLSRIFEQTQ